MFDYIYDDSLIDFEENKCEGCLLLRLCKSDVTVIGMDCRNEIGEDDGLYPENNWSELNNLSNFWKPTRHWQKETYFETDWEKYLSEG